MVRGKLLAFRINVSWIAARCPESTGKPCDTFRKKSVVRMSSAIEYARLFTALAGNGRECRSVELRALCNEVPRTPPGPEGSNGTGITSGAADHPKFLSLKQFSVISSQFSVRGMRRYAQGFFCTEH